MKYPNNNKFQPLDKIYLPDWGQGETLATQAYTAVSKLVYKYYNDGDVFDNSYELGGWWNNLSSYFSYMFHLAGTNL